MIITIEGEPKEIADLVLELQNRLSSKEMNSCLEEFQDELKAVLKNQIARELSSANCDNA